MISPINIFGDSNESSHGRLADLAAATIEDKRFCLKGTSELIADLRFENMPWSMNVELKDFTGEGNSDILSSLLSGHAWKQLRDLRQARQPGCFLILGTKKQLRESIQKASSNKNRPGASRSMDSGRLEQVYANLVKDFRRNCDCLNVKTFMVGEAPWFNDQKKTVFENLLHYVYKMSIGGDPFSHMPKWSDDELEIGALVDRINGLGPVRAAAICQHYGLRLVPKSSQVVDLEDITGIGPKTANLIRAELMA